MKKAGIILTIVCLLGVLSLSFNQKQDTGTAYAKLYLNKVEQFNRSQQNLLQTIQHASIADESGLGLIKNQIKLDQSLQSRFMVMINQFKIT